MDSKQATALVEETWNNSIVPTLQEYIRIPCKSPAFDADWQQHGYLDQAVELLVYWCKQQTIAGMKLSVERLEKRTPVIFIEVAGQSEETILLYGHLDKQPEMTGWDSDKGPWQPLLKNDRLYGRGGADDGYAIFAALTAIRLLQQQNIPHARCVILIEACEESGSFDLPAYMQHLKNKIGTPSFVIGLDSGCGNYDQLWNTTSLRGVINATLRVEILTEGVHSGAASGIVPSSFRILRQLLSRIEDEKTGEILVDALKNAIPADRLQEAKAVAETLHEQVWSEFPFVKGAKPMNADLVELVLNRTWRPTLSITGIRGIPDVDSAGNVLRPATEVMLSFRAPPTCDLKTAATALKKTLEKDPPYNAKVHVGLKQDGSGWNAPAVAPWLAKALNAASETYFGKPVRYWGEGGSIPFIGMLGQQFPQAQFLITGVLGPHSNAHGPNEFLHIPTAKKLTACVAEVIAAHFARQ